MKRNAFWLACTALAAFLLLPGAHAAEKIEVPTLPVPSLGYFLPPVIKAAGLDQANGLDLEFIQKQAATYRTDFAAGTHKIGGSGTVLADVALLKEKGVDVVYLFNVFDFWGTVVVPSDSEIKTLRDLQGKVLAAALPTTNYAMFRYFADRAGLDLATVKVRGTPVPGLVPTARVKRADAVQLWEPAYSVLTHGNDDFRRLEFVEPWKKETGHNAIPYLGVAVYRSWAEEHRELIPRLYRTYQAAAEFIRKDPDAAARAIAKDSGLDQEVVRDLLASDRLGLNVYWPREQQQAMDEVFRAAVSIGYLKEMPPAEVLYDPNQR